MKKIGTAILGFALSAALATAAAAADLGGGPPRGSIKDAPYPAAPLYSWSGVYVGAHVGYGMRRGSVVFAGAAPTLASTFVPAIAEAAVFWQLLARDLARHGGPWATLPQRRIERHLGDLAAAGKGELVVVA